MGENEHLFNWSIFNKIPIVGILRNIEIQDVEPIAEQFLLAGLTTLEVTMNSPNVEDQISLLLDKYRGQLNIGAGTVCSLSDLNRALKVGAQFIVTPVFNPIVVEKCVKEKIPIFPGAFSPTEIYSAWELGADMVKVFPANTLGPAYIKDISGPLDQIKILATGGINLNNIQEYKKAGVLGFGIGSELFRKELIQIKDWTGLRGHFKRYVDEF